MEFWLGLSANLVGCREDDGRRKEKGGDEKHMIGEGRRGERAGGGRRRENIKTGDDGVLCRDWRREITTH